MKKTIDIVSSVIIVLGIITLPFIKQYLEFDFAHGDLLYCAGVIAIALAVRLIFSSKEERHRQKMANMMWLVMIVLTIIFAFVW